MSSLYLVLLLLIVVGHSWKTNRRPWVNGHKFSRRALTPTSRQTQQKLVDHHNSFRTQVKPAAADMLLMSWHEGAALVAQRWADQCQWLTHDNLSDRRISPYSSCGQNILVSSHKISWLSAIKSWFLEHQNFTYGGVNSLLEVGHYTQLVWASTHKVGCGFAECGRNSGNKYFSYVCNYCPAGNYLGKLSRPYKRGKPCSGCPGHCRRNKLCTKVTRH